MGRTEDMEMTREAKIDKLAQGDDEAILRCYGELASNNRWGELDGDIELTKAEILKRMAAYKERS